MVGAPSTITAITSRRGTQRRTIELDGEPWIGLPASVVSSGSIAVGMRIDPDTFIDALADALESCARERAYRLLSFRDRSTHELLSRLVEDGYPPAVAQALIDDLTARGIVDDARFAEAYARMLARQRGLGRSRIEAELTRKGITADVALRTLDDMLPVEGEAERARAAASRLRRPSDSAQRLASRLVRRGFGQSLALRTALEAVGTADVADPDEVSPEHSAP